MRKPLDPQVFIGAPREEMRAELAALNEALPGLDWVEIKERNPGAIKSPPSRPATLPLWGPGATAVASDSMHFRAGPAASRRGSTVCGKTARTE
jgi:hypothetical protein